MERSLDFELRWHLELRCVALFFDSFRLLPKPNGWVPSAIRLRSHAIWYNPAKLSRHHVPTPNGGFWIVVVSRTGCTH